MPESLRVYNTTSQLWKKIRAPLNVKMKNVFDIEPKLSKKWCTMAIQCDTKALDIALKTWIQCYSSWCTKDVNLVFPKHDQWIDRRVCTALFCEDLTPYERVFYERLKTIMYFVYRDMRKFSIISDDGQIHQPCVIYWKRSAWTFIVCVETNQVNWSGKQ